MSEETALVPMDQTNAALAAFGFNDADQYTPTNLSLLQPIQVSDEPGLVAGKFRDQQSNLQYDSLNIVPLIMTDERVLFPPGGELGAKPVCRSNDGIFPLIHPELVRQDGGNGCKNCEQSQWGRVNGRSIKPPCAASIKFLFAELETGFVYRYNAKGMSIAPVKDLKETIRKVVFMAKAKGKFVPPYGLTFNLSSVKVKGVKGTYFIPKFVPTGQVHPDDLERFATIFRAVSSPKGSAAENKTADPVAQAIDGEYVGSPSGYEEA